MAGIFDTLSSAMGAGSIGEGVSKITDALMAPNAATQAAADKEKADMAAKGMVKTPGGDWVSKLDKYGLDRRLNTDAMVPKPNIATPAPAVAAAPVPTAMPTRMSPGLPAGYE